MSRNFLLPSNLFINYFPGNENLLMTIIDYFFRTMTCSIARTITTVGAYQMTSSNRIDTGTAAITTNDCKASIPPPPILIKMAAIVAIITAQNTRTGLIGFSSPVTAIEIEYAIESTVVTTNKVVKIKKIEGIMS